MVLYAVSTKVEAEQWPKITGQPNQHYEVEKSQG